MVSSVARFLSVHHRIQSPLRRPILLSVLEEHFHLRGTGTKRYRGSPRYLQILASTIFVLPTSSLRIFSSADHVAMPWEYFKDSLSSVGLRCGLSLTMYDSPIPLSDAVLNHLIQLPHLNFLRIHGPPPNYSATSLPPVFPLPGELAFGEGVACEWLPLLGRPDDGASTMQGVTPLSKTKQ